MELFKLEKKNSHASIYIDSMSRHTYVPIVTIVNTFIPVSKVFFPFFIIKIQFKNATTKKKLSHLHVICAL